MLPLVLALSACGSDDDGGEADPAPTTEGDQETDADPTEGEATDADPTDEETTEAESPEASGAGACDTGLDPNDPVQVSLGTIPIAALLPAYIATQEGWFQEAGLEVELTPEPGGQDIVTAVAAGEFDFGFSNQTSLLLAHMAGIGVKAVAAANVGAPDQDQAWDAVIVPEDSDIQTAEDLIGTTVSVNTLNNTPHLAMLRSLEVNGVDNPQDQVEFTEVQFPDAVAAVTQGHVAAAWVVEPFVTIGRFNGTRAILHPFVDTEPSLLVAAYFTSTQLIDDQPEVVEAFTCVINNAMEYTSNNPDAVRAAFPEFNPNAQEAVAEAMALPFWKTEISVGDFQVGAELAQQYGLIDEVPDDLEELIWDGANG